MTSNVIVARLVCAHIDYIRYTVSTPSPGIIRYDLAQLYQTIPYLNVPGTWYLSWKRSPTRNGLTVRAWVDYISTSNVIVARLLLLMCAYSRDSIVWPSHAHDLGQAALGAGHEAGRPCALATVVMIRTSMYGLRDSTAALLLLLLS